MTAHRGHCNLSISMHMLSIQPGLTLHEWVSHVYPVMASRWLVQLRHDCGRSACWLNAVLSERGVASSRRCTAATAARRHPLAERPHSQNSCKPCRPEIINIFNVAHITAALYLCIYHDLWHGYHDSIIDNLFNALTHENLQCVFRMTCKLLVILLREPVSAKANESLSSPSSVIQKSRIEFPLVM